MAPADRLLPGEIVLDEHGQPRPLAGAPPKARTPAPGAKARASAMRGWRLAASSEPSPMAWCRTCDHKYFGMGALAAAVAHLRASEGCVGVLSLQLHRLDKIPVDGGGPS